MFPFSFLFSLKVFDRIADGLFAHPAMVTPSSSAHFSHFIHDRPSNSSSNLLSDIVVTGMTKPKLIKLIGP
jgi:hypothetical protein